MLLGGDRSRWNTEQIAEVEGPDAGMRIVDQLSPSLGDFRYLYSTKPELLRPRADRRSS
jgi:predicted RNA polymerase sigma factor